MELTQERLKNLLRYDQETGEFRWLVDRQRARQGSIAGTICPAYGYRYIGVDYRRYRASRLAWFYMLGSWPDDLIDHVDRNRSNDRWLNLRPATHQQNQQNLTKPHHSLSGKIGVSWQPGRRRWMAHITHNGKTKNLGRYLDLADAINARKSAEKVFFTHAPQ